MPRQIHRRSFLKQSAGFALAGLTVRSLNGASPNDKLNIAIVGTQGKGKSNVAGVMHENIVAICDVDNNNLGKCAEQFPAAERFRDFRQMLNKLQSKIDAVVVSTADHTHAPATMAAIQLGKHVYCEKPLTHTVEEARKIAEAAKAKKVATQMGTQIHASENYRRVVELVQSGAIGKVDEAHVWVGRSWSDGKFTTGTQAPAYLDWDLWLGPSASRPYSENVHPFNWRKFWDFGSGTLGDMGCHIMDLAHWALDLRHPSSVVAEGPPVDAVGTPAWMTVQYEYPRKDGSKVKLNWYDGGKLPDAIKTAKVTGKTQPAQFSPGILFVGSGGMLAATYGSYVLLPEEKFSGFQPPPKTIPASLGHYIEWINGCKTGSPTTCNFDYAGALTEAVLLGMVAYRTGEPLAWDPVQLRAANTSKADQYIRKEYRPGWYV